MHRRTIGLIGGVVGGLFAVIGGSIWAYRALTDPPVPEVANAPAEQIIDFLAHPRGFARLAAKT